MLKMKFVGAIEGVTGSCTWLHHTDSDTQLLVDCGIHQGDENFVWQNSQPFPFEPKKIKYVLLTHAHLDHCGLLPRLIKEGFTGAVYATQATQELTRLMLKDAGRISGDYNEEDLERIRWRPVDRNDDFRWGTHIVPLSNGLVMRYLRSSHILGACMFNLSWKAPNPEHPAELLDRNICFSGDVGCQSAENAYLPLMKDGHNPFPSGVDYIVVESTYGSRVRDAQYLCAENRLARLGQAIAHTLNKGGKVLIPAFSLHRTQEVLMDLLQWMKQELPRHRPSTGEPVSTLIHAPLGQSVTRIYATELFSRGPQGKFKYLNPALCKRLAMSAEAIQNMLQRLVKQEDVKGSGYELRMFNPKVINILHTIATHQIIVSSAGMCDAGPVVDYLEHLAGDPRNTIILTGFQSPGTRGHELMQRASHHLRPMHELDAYHAEVIDLSAFYSAHADQQMLLDFIFRTDGFPSKIPSTVFLNHGNYIGKRSLQEAILERASQNGTGERPIAGVRIADARWINLDDGQVIPEPPTQTVSSETEEIEKMRKEIEALKALMRIQNGH